MAGKGVIGLQNLGKTCFANAIIQCLAFSTPLAQYFRGGCFYDDLVRNGKHGTKGEVAKELAVVIQKLWSEESISIAPRDFMKTFHKHASMFAEYEQQDSHEFLIVLLDKLHNDLNKRKCSQPNQLLCLDNLPAETAQQNFWENHKRLNDSIISKLFEGLMQSTLECRHCNKISNSYEVFSFLSLPITSSTTCTLTECLERFFKTEVMADTAAWYCSQCKRHREASKRTIICQFPEILVIHLNRFSFEGMWRSKLQTYVHFPIDLQMKPYFLKNESLQYKLYAVVNHYGIMEHGHYTAFCKNTIYNRWYAYDDHNVYAINNKQLKTASAYIFFYSRTDNKNYLKH